MAIPSRSLVAGLGQRRLSLNEGAAARATGQTQ